MGEQIAIWSTACGCYYVELVKRDGQYLLNASPGIYLPDLTVFEDDAEADRYVNRRVAEGSFDPPPLAWRRE